MRFSLSALVFAASLAFVNAQDLGDIPSCALSCFAAAVSASGCSLSDTKCQCTTGSDKIQSSVTSCVPSKCSTDDIAKIAPAVASICAKAGVTVSNLPTAVPSATGSNSSSNASRTTSMTMSATGTRASGAAQSTGGAGANAAGVGAIALGLGLAAVGL